MNITKPFCKKLTNTNFQTKVNLKQFIYHIVSYDFRKPPMFQAAYWYYIY